MNTLEDLMIIIPSYEIEENFIGLLKELSETDFMGILVVNDGSGEKFESLFWECRKINKVFYTGYDVNQGKGHAIKTGFQYIFDNFPECRGIVTADCDGQHTVKDICRMGEALISNPDHLILGARNCLKENVPMKSRIGNRFTRWIFKLCSGISVQDTQTGLRAMSTKAMECFINTDGERFEYEMNVLAECRKYDIGIFEIPIDTVYIAGNRSTHYRMIRDSARISKVFFKFASSSLLSALIDYFLFISLLALFNEHLPETGSFQEILGNVHLMIAFFGARLISSATNFIINRKIVFRIKNKIFIQIIKYYSIVAVIALLTFLLMSVLTVAIPPQIAQPMATLVLFMLSYFFQKRFVFKY